MCRGRRSPDSPGPEAPWTTRSSTPKGGPSGGDDAELHPNKHQGEHYVAKGARTSNPGATPQAPVEGGIAGCNGGEVKNSTCHGVFALHVLMARVADVAVLPPGCVWLRNRIGRKAHSEAWQKLPLTCLPSYLASRDKGVVNSGDVAAVLLA